MTPNSHPKNPFKGLRPFNQAEQEELFGRERDLILMKDRILSSRTTLLFAGSGVGKTSFLNAKVIPALEERYCVIWHNRWTGADERSDAILDDHARLRFWPPRAFARWFSEWLIEPAWLRQKHSETNFVTWEQAKLEAASAETDAGQKKVTEAVQNVISKSLRPGNKRRLSRVLSIFKKKPESTGAEKPCILILDQFEEIFQYHAYETYFQDFISDLCEVINDESYQVRVVFSMREEFLGELSVFDNRIPDLFNNYYRLRYPEKDEAKYIIEQTCKLVNVTTAAENLDKLVDDLSTIEKSFEGDRVDGAKNKTVRFVRRNFVPPPYLQIVCDTLWKEQFEKPVQPATVMTVTTKGDDAEKTPVRFLENYKAGVEDAVNGEESGAQKAVREFCRAKLSPPFLKKWEQNVAARAFGFLVTKQGAKMAYELRSLASHMDERVWPLRHTLHKLSLPEARILRESRGPEGSYWFELYHDMYASVVDRWKREYTKVQRKRQQRKFAVYACLVALLVLMPFAVNYWYLRPREYRHVITQFRDTLDTTDIRNSPAYTKAITAYYKLMGTIGYFDDAQLLWAAVWQKRAHLFEAREQREEALLSLLVAASLARNTPLEKDYIAEANNLLIGDETAIRRTYCYDCRYARFSPDGRFVLTITKNNAVDVWSSDGNAASTVCFDCKEAQFSADSNLVASVRELTEEKSRADANRERTRGGSETDSGMPARGSRPSTPEPTPTPGTTSSTAKNVIGWEVKITGVEPVSFVIRKPQAATNKPPGRQEDFDLTSFAKTPAGYLVAGSLAGKLNIWRGDGSTFSESLPIERPTGAPGHPFTSFSPDGKFFAVYGSNTQGQLFEVSATGLSRVTKIEKLSSVRAPLFSPDGKYFLAQTSEGEVKLWELSGQTEVLKASISSPVYKIGFATGSSKFFVAEHSGTVTVWDSETKEQAYSFPVKTRVGTGFLAKDGRSLILSPFLSFMSTGYQKWSSETKQKIGELKLSAQSGPNEATFVSSDGDSLLIATNSIVRLWDIPPLPSEDSNWINKISKESTESGLSEDGNTMLLRGSKVQRLDINQKKESFPPIEAFNYAALSPDGNRIVNVTSETSADLFDCSKPQQPPIPLSFNALPGAVAFSPDSRFLAVATNDKKVQVFDTTNGAVIRSFVTDVDGPLTFTRDNQYLLVSDDDSYIEPDDPFENTEVAKRWVEVWSMQNGQNTLSQLDQKEKVQAVAMRNDRLALFQNQKILVLNVKTGERIREFPYAQDLALLELSPDEKTVITSDRKGVVQFWDADSGTAGPTITLGSPPMRIIFDDASFLAVTSAWIHQIEIGKDYTTLVNGHIPLNPPPTLRYAQGILTGEIDPDSVRLVTSKPAQEGQTPVKFLRWFRTGPLGIELVERSFDGKLSKSILNNSADNLLEEWRRKLGFIVSEDGILETGLDLSPLLRDLRNSVK
jgi:WD40 repeat protein